MYVFMTPQAQSGPDGRSTGERRHDEQAFYDRHANDGLALRHLLQVPAWPYMLLGLVGVAMFWA